MATILPFIVRRGPIARSRHSGASASIIIFPGVRYERQPDRERPKASDATQRKRKNKTQ